MPENVFGGGGGQNEPTIADVIKILTAFMEETRGNFSALTNDRETDNHLLEQINTNCGTIISSIQNLSIKLENTATHIKESNQNVVAAVENKTDDVVESVAKKKIIVQQIGHYNLGLWWADKLAAIKKKFRG